MGADSGGSVWGLTCLSVTLCCLLFWEVYNTNLNSKKYNVYTDNYGTVVRSNIPAEVARDSKGKIIGLSYGTSDSGKNQTTTRPSAQPGLDSNLHVENVEQLERDERR